MCAAGQLPRPLGQGVGPPRPLPSAVGLVSWVVGGRPSLWLSFLSPLWLVFASASGRLTIFRIGSHSDYPNSYLAFYSSLQLNTFGSHYWSLLILLIFGYFGDSTWGLVASCSGVVCFTGSGVQQSRP